MSRKSKAFRSWSNPKLVIFAFEVISGRKNNTAFIFQDENHDLPDRVNNHCSVNGLRCSQFLPDIKGTNERICNLLNFVH